VDIYFCIKLICCFEAFTDFFACTNDPLLDGGLIVWGIARVDRREPRSDLNSCYYYICIDTWIC